MMSCTLVNRLRVRRAASSDDMLAAEDVLLSVDDSMVVVGDIDEQGWARRRQYLSCR